MPQSSAHFSIRVQALEAPVIVVRPVCAMMRTTFDAASSGVRAATLAADEDSILVNAYGGRIAASSAAARCFSH